VRRVRRCRAFNPRMSRDGYRRRLAAVRCGTTSARPSYMLIVADVVRGRTMTARKFVQAELRSAGANVVDQAVVVDGNLVTSRKPGDLDAFSRASLSVLGHASAVYRHGDTRTRSARGRIARGAAAVPAPAQASSPASRRRSCGHDPRHPLDRHDRAGSVPALTVAGEGGSRRGIRAPGLSTPPQPRGSCRPSAAPLMRGCRL
jgi:hypothetical protein